MNKTAIKNFAIWARNKLIADIQYRAGLMGITAEGIKPALPQSTAAMEFYDIGTPEPYAIAGDAIRQRGRLVEIIRQKEKDSDYPTAYKYILEEVAYTWFNRLIAIRFMEVNDYLPSHIRVLSSEGGKVEPDLVTTPFDAGLTFSPAEEETILRLKAENRLDELFRLLFIKQCNALNELLPALFEPTSDYTELLLNLSVVDQEGVVYRLVHDITEDDFNIERGGQVEIIGWLYQYYNTEPKNAAFSKNGKITKEEIPAVTQLFTPDWIVRYMVENSLGRLWLEYCAPGMACGNGEDALRELWMYYIDEADQEPEVEAQLAAIRAQRRDLQPQDIRFLDPCMGSGHILVYAFEVLMEIYESQGWSQRDAAQSILEHNLYGLDIDDRAAQLAYFAVMMKAREYDRRILTRGIRPNLYAIRESDHINRIHLSYLGAGLTELERNDADNQIRGFLDSLEDAKNFGSLVCTDNLNWPLLHRFVSGIDHEGQMSMDAVGLEDTCAQLAYLLEVGETLARQYDVVVTNPPYMAVSNGNAALNQFVKDNYPDSKGDLFACFIERCKRFTKKCGYQAMITQQAWMFTATYEKLREKLSKITIINLLQLGARGFDEINGEVVQTATFVIMNSNCPKYCASYFDLTAGDNEALKENLLQSRSTFYRAIYSDFKYVPNFSMAYWLSHNALRCFKYDKISKKLTTREGMTTADNDRFLRNWPEIIFSKMLVGCTSTNDQRAGHKKWFPYNKGGPNRKWYGNYDLVVNWENDGLEIRNNKDKKTGRIRSHNYNAEYSFRESGTWTAICSGDIMVRYSPQGALFDSKGASLFSDSTDTLLYALGMLNSKVSSIFFKVLSPAYEYKVGHVANVPLLQQNEDTVVKFVRLCIILSQNDWDSYETSWDFKRHPLV